MTSDRRTWIYLGAACWSLCALAGCGGSNSAPAVSSSEQVAEEDESPIGLPTVAINGPKTPAGNAAKAPAKGAPQTLPAVEEKQPPRKGSPEWILEEIQKIKAMPLPGAEPKQQGKATPATEEEIDDEIDKVLTPEEEQKLKQQFEKSKAERRARNLQIVKLAESGIVATAKQPEMEGSFDACVHYLLEAHLQLAAQGENASIDAIYEAAKAFYTRKPDSVAAADAELTLVNLTHMFAMRYGQTQPKWLQEFAKHSQLFATRFPEEAHRSVPLLSAAARGCELAGLTAEATNCYSLLLTKFKDTPQAQQASGVVRRLQLKGKTLQLAGPTMDGDDLNIESYRGKMVVVVFWATHARPFVEQLPKLQATLKKYEKYAVPVGINLDADENVVEAFIEKNGMHWPQIFSPNRSQRGWNCPLAVHYGINDLPTIWLVDPNGVVADTSINAENLASRMFEVYRPFLKPPVNGIQQ